MLGSTVLDVAIGVVLVFSILSLAATSAREMIEAHLQTRAVHLERGLRELLNDQTGEGLAKQLYNHPIISSLYRGKYDPVTLLTQPILKRNDAWQRVRFRSSLPAYIPARNFARALLDIAARGEAGSGDSGSSPISFEGLRRNIQTLEQAQLRRALLIALDDAHGDLDRARANLENWFDSSMDRVSGWYRKQTQWILLGLGLAAAVLLNVDALRLATALYQDDAMRSVIVDQADAASSKFASGTSGDIDTATLLNALGCSGTATAETIDAGGSVTGSAALTCSQQRLEKLGLPIGWSGHEFIWPGKDGLTLKEAWRRSNFPWGSIPGWLVTALGVSLGAPFWFDLLNKMMVIRSTVKPHEKSPEEASEDRQHPSSPNSSGAAGQALTGAQPSTGPATAVLAGPGREIEAEPLDFKPHQWRQGDREEGEL